MSVNEDEAKGGEMAMARLFLSMCSVDGLHVFIR